MPVPPFPPDSTGRTCANARRPALSRTTFPLRTPTERRKVRQLSWQQLRAPESTAAAPTLLWQPLCPKSVSLPSAAPVSPIPDTKHPVPPTVPAAFGSQKRRGGRLGTRSRERRLGLGERARWGRRLVGHALTFLFLQRPTCGAQRGQQHQQHGSRGP